MVIHGTGTGTGTGEGWLVEMKVSQNLGWSRYENLNIGQQDRRRNEHFSRGKRHGRLPGGLGVDS